LGEQSLTKWGGVNRLAILTNFLRFGRQIVVWKVKCAYCVASGVDLPAK